VANVVDHAVAEGLVARPDAVQHAAVVAGHGVEGIDPALRGQLGLRQRWIGGMEDEPHVMLLGHRHEALVHAHAAVVVIVDRERRQRLLGEAGAHAPGAEGDEGVATSVGLS
jgi:hypothetical protein